MLFYNILLVLACLIAIPFLPLMLLFKKKWRQGLGGRLGMMDKAMTEKALQLKTIWFHGASMGEAQAFVPVVRELKKLAPEYAIAVTTTSVTGRDRVRKELGELAAYCCLMPLDLPFLVSGFIKRLNPAALITVETEIWPNMITAASKRDIPIVLINGRISKKTFGAYYFFRAFFRRILSRYSLFMVQNEKMARRLKLIGIDDSSKILIQSNTKYSSAEARRDPNFDFDKKGRFVVVAGSIRKGEEEGILRGFAAAEDADMRLVIAPRHLSRVPFIIKTARQLGLDPVLRSSLKVLSEIINHRVCVLDTMGELAKMYAAGDAAIIGGGFVKMGGHNPMEAAAMGLPVIFGRYMYNFEDTSAKMVKEGGAFSVENPAEGLAAVLKELKENPGKRKYIGEKNRSIIERHRGSAATTAIIINEIMIDKKMGVDNDNE